MSSTHFGILLLLLFIPAAVALGYYRSQQAELKQKRATFIRSFAIPATLRSKVALKFPQLDSAQLDQLFQGLRQFFLVCLYAEVNATRTVVGMPSRAVDEAWHEFILMSRDYARFCEMAFGSYLHHTPDGAMKISMERALINTLQVFRTRSRQAGGWTTIAGIPLLFALDKALGIADGFHYGQAEIDRLEAKRAKVMPTDSDGAGTNCAWSFGGGDAGCDSSGVSGCGSGCGGGCSSD